MDQKSCRKPFAWPAEWLSLVAGLWLVGCGQAAMIGVEPNEPGIEMEATGAQQHQAAARREEARIRQHKGLYKPNALQSVRRCDPEHASRHPGAPACWVETVNPTAIHLAEMEAHRTRAAYHRKAARELRAAEREACLGARSKSGSILRFADRRDIEGVSPLQDSVTGKNSKMVGATIFIRAVKGLTQSKLQSIVDCHAAHNAAAGYALTTTEANRSPLSERGAQATVRKHSRGFAVDIRAEDPFVAQAIWLRAQRLARVE